jgi:hypothetical protein
VHRSQHKTNGALRSKFPVLGSDGIDECEFVQLHASQHKVKTASG